MKSPPPWLSVVCVLEVFEGIQQPKLMGVWAGSLTLHLHVTFDGLETMANDSIIDTLDSPIFSSSNNNSNIYILSKYCDTVILLQ